MSIEKRSEFSRQLVRAMKHRPTIEHPIFGMLLHSSPNKPLLQLLAVQMYQLTKMFERYVAALFYRCPVPEFRRNLAENLYEEVTGALSGSDGHLEMMLRFVKSLDLTVEEIERATPIPEATALIEYRRQLVDDPARFHEAVGAVMIASEGQTIQRVNGKLAYESLATVYNLSAADLQFFEVHAKEDVEHVGDGLRLAQLVCDTDQKRAECVAAVSRTCELFWNFYEGVMRVHTAGRSA